jgi:DNA recombination protein RmuC
MPGILLGVVVGLEVVIVLLLIWLLRRPVPLDLAPLEGRLDSLEKAQERIERTVREDFASNRQEGGRQARELREEVQNSVRSLAESITVSLGRVSAAQSTQLQALLESNERRFDTLRSAVEAKLDQIRRDNEGKLEEMRKTVDEKLEGTLEKRLGESFKLVSERLELVHKGLGEMQTLASGVGDLKKVLTNVKTRGTWGEFAVGNLLDQVLSPDQYAANVVTKEGSDERVEFAIRLPGRDEGENEVVWLPIDAKFPKEDYERLVDAADRGDSAAIEEAGRQLETRIKNSARDICDKYLNPPKTTDFALMYLPTEGLYAEVVRRPGLVENIQREHRVVVAGPTTFAALLNSLQMGFRTLAIEKRSSEVWKVLGAVKAEFGKFGDVLGSVKKKLHQAADTIDKAETRTRAISRRLRGVEELPAAEARALLGAAELSDEGEEEEAG